MKTNRRTSHRISPVMLMVAAVVLVLPASFAAAEGESPQVLGSVVGIGVASMKTALNTWIPMDGRTLPVVNGSAFKTAEGTIYIGTKDGATLELGKKTETVLRGAIKDYRTQLDIGTLAFKVYRGTGLMVKTPNATVAVQPSWQTGEKGSQTFKDEISGIITYDGVETRVFCSRGKFSLTPSDGDTRYLAEGDVAVIGARKGEEPAVPNAQARASGSLTVAAENPATSSPRAALRSVETGGLEVVSEKTP